MTELLVPISIVVFEVNLLMNISGIVDLASSGKVVHPGELIGFCRHGQIRKFLTLLCWEHSLIDLW